LHLDPFLYLFDDYIWYLRTVNTSHRDARCNRALLRPRTDGVDSLRCHATRRVDADCRQGGRERSFFLEGVAVDGPTPPFRFGVAHRAFQWRLLVVEKPSSRLVKPPLFGAESVPCLECVELGSSMALACCVAALLLPLHSDLLEGSG